jgi:hypothetical protein
VKSPKTACGRASYSCDDGQEVTLRPAEISIRSISNRFSCLVPLDGRNGNTVIQYFPHSKNEELDQGPIQYLYFIPLNVDRTVFVLHPFERRAHTVFVLHPFERRAYTVFVLHPFERRAYTVFVLHPFKRKPKFPKKWNTSILYRI